MRKTIYLSGKNNQIIEVLKLKAEGFGNKLEVVGAKAYDDKVISECSYLQPDFLICDEISKNDAITFFESCPNGNLIIISNDMNRSNNLSTELNKLNYFNISIFDMNNIQPTGLLQMLTEFDSKVDLSYKNQAPVSTPRTIEECHIVKPVNEKMLSNI